MRRIRSKCAPGWWVGRRSRGRRARPRAEHVLQFVDAAACLADGAAVTPRSWSAGRCRHRDRLGVVRCRNRDRLIGRSARALRSPRVRASARRPERSGSSLLCFVARRRRRCGPCCRLSMWRVRVPGLRGHRARPRAERHLVGVARVTSPALATRTGVGPRPPSAPGVAAAMSLAPRCRSLWPSSPSMVALVPENFCPVFGRARFRSNPRGYWISSNGALSDLRGADS
jgi:hypothetical protein